MEFTNDPPLADEAIRFMKAHRGSRFFCNFWMFSPHGGPQGKPSMVEKYTRKIGTLPADYPQRNPDTASLIEEMDRVVDRMVDSLEETGIADRTRQGAFAPSSRVRLAAEGLTKTRRNGISTSVPRFRPPRSRS